MSSPSTKVKNADRRKQLSRRLRGGGLWIVIGRAAGMGTVLASYMYLAREAPTEAFAAYVLTSSLVACFSVVAMFGLNTLACRYISESFAVSDPARARTFLSVAVRLSVLSSGLAGGFAWVTLVFLGEVVFGMPELTQHAGLIACWIVLLAISQILAEAFRGLHHLQATAIFAGVSGGLVASVIFLFGIIILSLVADLTFVRIVVVSLVSLLIPSIVSAALLRHVWPKRPSVSRQDHDLAPIHLAAVAREAWPVMLARLTGFGIAQLDIWIVGACCSTTDLAVYAIIRRLSLLVAVPLSQVNLTVSSSIAELHARGDRSDLQRIVRGAATVGAVFAGLPALVLMLFPSLILGLAFGQAFQMGAHPLQILLLGQLVFALTGPCGPALMMTGHQRTSLCSMMSVLPVFAIAPWAATNFGLIGAAGIFAVAISVQNLIQSIAVARLLGIITRPSFSPRYIRRLLTA